ncbi:MAG: thioredoxin [Candidatus Symbiothrix sp.]|jgi:thioredoxin 1|nr:thioredoxin [Candidatus Symbiothrix sp.]
MALQITDGSFNELIAGELPVVVDFWASWCGPCKMVGPIVDELAGEYEGRVIVGKLNVDDNPNTPLEYNIRSIPTILFFKKGELVDKHVGAAQKSLLDNKIKAIL